MKEGQITLVVVLLVLGLIVVSGLYATTSRTAQQYSEVITVSDSVEREVMPDEAHVYVEIRTRADIAGDAKNQNAEVSDNVLATLYDAGVDEDEIETTSYYLSEETKWDKTSEEYIVTGYVLTHIIKVTTDDVENAGEIVDTAVNAGATGIESIQFTLSQEKESELKVELLAEAAQKAKAKAENLVEAVDADLGKLVSMSESSYYNRPYAYYERAFAVAEESVETSISPEQLTVSATVTLTYEIVQ